MNWKPIRKVALAGVLGPVATALLAWATTGTLDWKVPAAAVLTATIAYLVPSPVPVSNGRHAAEPAGLIEDPKYGD